MNEDRTFIRQSLPWIITAIALIVAGWALLSKRSSPSDNGVVQDGSGRRVIAWIDPMYSQGGPHLYKSTKPGIAPDCQMKLVPQYADDVTSTAATSTVSGYSSVSLPPARQQLIGVKLATAHLRPMASTTRAVGRVAVDERRTAQIRTKFDGFIESLYVNFTGESVRRGQPLMSVYSPDLLATQQELIVAARHRGQVGDSFYEAAKRRLLLWDMSSADIDAVARTGRAQKSVVIHSPVDGVVLSKTAVAGARVTPMDTLYELADLRSVWVIADLYQSDSASIRVGTPAQVVLSSTGGQTMTGRISFVSPIVNPATRTTNVRIELASPAGLLKPDMFVDVHLGNEGKAVVAVPDSAVMKTGTRSIVFVQTKPGQFDPREVTTGAHVDGFYEIQRGVSAGEVVVADANFLVDSESRLQSALR